jgi:hypothetical protein
MIRRLAPRRAAAVVIFAGALFAMAAMITASLGTGALTWSLTASLTVGAMLSVVAIGLLAVRDSGAEPVRVETSDPAVRSTSDHVAAVDNGDGSFTITDGLVTPATGRLRRTPRMGLLRSRVRPR